MKVTPGTVEYLNQARLIEAGVTSPHWIGDLPNDCRPFLCIGADGICGRWLSLTTTRFAACGRDRGRSEIQPHEKYGDAPGWLGVPSYIADPTNVFTIPWAAFKSAATTQPKHARRARVTDKGMRRIAPMISAMREAVPT